MTPTPPGQVEDRSRYSRQIEEAFEAAARLAGSNLAPAEFYEQFLNRALTAIDAPAGAIWLRTPQGFLQVACQLNLEKVGLDSRRGGRQCHNEILRQVFQAAPPRPVMLEPNARLGGTTGEPGPVPPANLTDHFALFAPIVTPDKQPLGVLEVFQDPNHDPRMYPAFLNYAFQMAGYASQYHQFINARSGSGTERTFTQVESFARLVHGTLNPTEVAYHVANEGRKLVECDRMCVGVRHSRYKVTVEAVSGADVVEKASTHVRRLRHLMESVLHWGEPLVFKGTKDAGLPPDVSEALEDYLHESQPKLLVVQPIRDDREKDTTKPARSVLVLESFNPPENPEPLIQRLEVVGKHAAPALYNAAEMKRVPLKPLWWPLAKLQEGVGGKARFFGLLGLLVATGLIAAMIAVPYPLRMEAKGQMLPVEIAQIFPPRTGVVREIRARPGDQISPRFEAVSLFDPELNAKYGEAQEKFRQSSTQVALFNRVLDDPNMDPKEKVNYRQQLVIAESDRDASRAVMDSLDKQFNCDRQKPGYFRAIAPSFEAKLARPLGVSQWTVLNDDRQETLLGKTVRPEQELLRVGNLQGPWQIELKIPQRNIGQILKAFGDPSLHKEEPETGKKYLDVDVLLSSQPDASYLGRLYRDGISAQAVPGKTDQDENEPVVTAYVKLNLNDFPEQLKIPTDQFVTGLEVRTRIRCGEHAMGYSMFHGVWEWFYEKVVFLF